MSATLGFHLKNYQTPGTGDPARATREAEGPVARGPCGASSVTRDRPVCGLLRTLRPDLRLPVPTCHPPPAPGEGHAATPSATGPVTGTESRHKRHVHVPPSLPLALPPPVGRPPTTGDCPRKQPHDGPHSYISCLKGVRFRS